LTSSSLGKETGKQRLIIELPRILAGVNGGLLGHLIKELDSIAADSLFIGKND
jgi:hypothetical protein